MLMLRREIVLQEFDDFDDLVISVVYLRTLENGYKELGLDVPEWLREKVKEGDYEIAHRTRARKERQLTELRMKADGLMTTSEKREKVNAEIERLEKELAS